MRQMLLSEQAEENRSGLWCVHALPELVSAIRAAVQTGIVPGGYGIRANR